MQVNIQKITQKALAKLNKEMLKLLDEGGAPEFIDTDQSVTTLLATLHHLRHEHKILSPILRELGILSDDKPLSRYEKGIKTIAREEIVEKLIHPEKIKQKWMTSRLKLYAQHHLPEFGAESGQFIARTLYNKENNILKTRMNRAKSSPKVNELAEKHPNIDVKRIVALGTVLGKIELTNSDLDWIDSMLTIVESNKIIPLTKDKTRD